MLGLLRFPCVGPESFQSRLCGENHRPALVSVSGVSCAPVCSESSLRGVGQLHASRKFTPPALRFAFVARHSAPLSASWALGVGNCIVTAALRLTVTLIPSRDCPVGLHPGLAVRPPFPSLASAVGHNPDSVPSMRRSDSLSAHHDRPDAVTDLVQRIVYPVIAASAESREDRKSTR